MNVEIESELDFGLDRLSACTTTVLNLPEPFRATHFNWGEDERRIPVADREKTAAKLLGKTYGFFLYGPGIAYDLTYGRNKTITLRTYFETSHFDVSRFLRILATVGPLFGFASSEKERIARNRVAKSFGINNLEGWVGRYPGNQLPGLYWYTLISDDLLRKLDIPLASLLAMAKEYQEPAAGQHLFRFYDRPEDWRTAGEVNRFIVDQPGIFNIEEVKPQLERVDTFLEITSLLARWP